MAGTADDLSAPLGQTTRRRKRHFRPPFTGLQALAVLLGLFLATFAGFAIFSDNPLGGEPIAHVALRQTAPTGNRGASKPAQGAEHGMRPAAEQGAKAAPKQSAAGEQKTVTII